MELTAPQAAEIIMRLNGGKILPLAYGSRFGAMVVTGPAGPANEDLICGATCAYLRWRQGVSPTSGEDPAYRSTATMLCGHWAGGRNIQQIRLLAAVHSFWVVGLLGVPEDGRHATATENAVRDMLKIPSTWQDTPPAQATLPAPSRIGVPDPVTMIGAYQNAWTTAYSQGGYAMPTHW